MSMPIRVRLTLWYIGVLAAVLLAFSAGVLWLQGRYSRMQFDTELGSVAMTATSVLRSELAVSHQLARAAADTRKAVDIPNRSVVDPRWNRPPRRGPLARVPPRQPAQPRGTVTPDTHDRAGRGGMARAAAARGFRRRSVHDSRRRRRSADCARADGAGADAAGRHAGGAAPVGGRLLVGGIARIEPLDADERRSRARDRRVAHLRALHPGFRRRGGPVGTRLQPAARPRLRRRRHPTAVHGRRLARTADAGVGGANRR